MSERESRRQHHAVSARADVNIMYYDNREAQALQTQTQ